MTGWHPEIKDPMWLAPVKVSEKKDEPQPVTQSWPFMVADQEDGHEVIDITTP